MDFLLTFLRSMPGAVGQGLIWGIMAIGVYLTYKILDVADLTVDGSLATGGAVCALLTVNGANPATALVCAVLAGMLAGLVTGLFHTACGIPAILSGILTQLALYSINLRIMGWVGWGADNGTKATLAVSVDKNHLLVSSRYIRELGLQNPLLPLGIFVVVTIAVLYWFFGTELGSSIRATGANRSMARAQGINTDFNVVLGLMISNGLVALAGGLLAQYQGSSTIDMGRGAIVIGLAAVIIGVSAFRWYENSGAARRLREVKGLRFLALPRGTTAVVVGSILYKFCIQMAMLLVPSSLMKLVTAALFLLVLVASGRKGEEIIHA